jgi:hypothetical protein
MATDRLTLARAFSDSGMAQGRAEAVATAIFDAIHDNVATKADIAAVRADIAAARAEAQLIEHRLMTRLGGLVVVVAGLMFAALHYWPPGHGG